MFTHNDIEPGMNIELTGCNGAWLVVGLIDGHRGIKVQPEDLREDAIWVDVSEVTGIRSDYRPSGLLFDSFCTAGEYLRSKGFEYDGASGVYIRTVGRYTYRTSQVYQGDTKCVRLSFERPKLNPTI